MAKNEISPDSTKAEEILDIDELKKQAEQGDAEAQFKLGVCYDNGNGVPQSDTEAVKWWSLAAKQGCVEANYNLGVCY